MPQLPVPVPYHWCFLFLDSGWWLRWPEIALSCFFCVTEKKLCLYLRLKGFVTAAITNFSAQMFFEEFYDLPFSLAALWNPHSARLPELHQKSTRTLCSTRMEPRWVTYIIFDSGSESGYVGSWTAICRSFVRCTCCTKVLYWSSPKDHNIHLF